MRLPWFFLRKNGKKNFLWEESCALPEHEKQDTAKVACRISCDQYLCHDQGCSNRWEFAHFSRMIRKWRVLKLLQLFRTSAAGKHKNFKCLAKPALNATKKKKKKKTAAKNAITQEYNKELANLHLLNTVNSTYSHCQLS